MPPCLPPDDVLADAFAGKLDAARRALAPVLMDVSKVPVAQLEWAIHFTRDGVIGDIGVPPARTPIRAMWRSR